MKFCRIKQKTKKIGELQSEDLYSTNLQYEGGYGLINRYKNLDLVVIR